MPRRGDDVLDHAPARRSLVLRDARKAVTAVTVPGQSGESGELGGSGESGGSGADAWHRRLHHIAPAALRADTAQTTGMQRREAISGDTVGSSALWMGQTHVAPATASDNHHHGESETAIYVVSGHPVFVFAEGDGPTAREVRIEASPGDYVYVPPFVPHREENPDADSEAVVVIARSTQQAIVVNLPALYGLPNS